VTGCFVYCIAVAKDVPFKERFLEMAGLSTKTGSPLFNESFPFRRMTLASWM
jgi:hypothetical protein